MDRIRNSRRFIPPLLFIAGAALVHAGGNVEKTSVGFIPLNELGNGTYQAKPGGLYPDGLNEMPSAHRVAGLAKAAGIQPLDNAGNPSPTGKIVILTIGMSNAFQVFSKVGELMQGLWAPGVVWINAAQGGVDAALWADPNHSAWTKAMGNLSSAGVTSAQVQVVLNFHAVAHSKTAPKPWPATPDDLRIFQEAIAGHLVAKFANVKMCWWGTREYGGYATTANNPEPYAYQSAFAVKWMIERQIQGIALNHDPANGPVTAPWMAWGPYLWADGLNARADGLFWEPRDFQSDGVHPNSRGRAKEAGPWVRLIRTEPLISNWAVPAGNLPPVTAITFPQDNVTVSTDGPLAIEAFAQDDDGSIARVDFYQGATLLGTDSSAPYRCLWRPTATGDYPIHVVATDDVGANRSSATVLAKIQQSPAAAGTLANDSFESGDFQGGGGWTMDAWLTSGPATVTNSTASDGTWSAQLGAVASIARSLPLEQTAGAALEFDWIADLPSGAGFTVEIHNGSWKPIFTRNSTSGESWVRESIPLDAQTGATAFGIRFRTTGSGAYVGVDHIDLKRPQISQVPPPACQLSLSHAGHKLLRWSAAKGKTYAIQSSENLIGWNEIHHTTADETSEVIFTGPTAGNRGFFRIRTLGPSD